MINTNITENIVNIANIGSGSNNLNGVSLPILLKELKLPVISDLYGSYATKADADGWGYTKYLAKLCENELEARNTKQIEAYLKQSHLPSGKSITNFEFSHLPNITKTRVNDLVLGCTWARQAENVLIFGPSGVGKTHLAAAIGHSLVQKQIRVLFTSTTKLVQNLQICNRDCKLAAALAKLDKYDVIILDDIGYVKKEAL